MDPDGPADPPDGQEQLDEVRLRGEQFTELVDHHEQVRHGGRTPAVPAGGGGASPPSVTAAVVLGDVRQVPGLGKYLLPPLHLPEQGVVQPVDQTVVVGEVGDHRRGQVSSPAKVAPPL